MLPELPPLNVTELLRRYNLRPNKGLGQNFLVDPVALQRVVGAAEISPNDTVLEIGAGLGSLTRLLAARARRVVAVELDASLLPPLEETLSPFQNVTIVHGDILALDPRDLVAETPGTGDTSRDGSYLLVANIPYNITSAIIRHVLESDPQPRCIVLTIQQEVAERITAGPGDLSLLALSVQVYGEPRIAARIPAGAFYPPPEVDSAVLRVDVLPQPRIPAKLLPAFFRLAKAGFSQKRKNLRNSLAGGLGWKPARSAGLLEAAGIEPMRRAETLSLAEWGWLAEVFTQQAIDSAQEE